MNRGFNGDFIKMSGGYDDFRPVVMWFWNDALSKEELSHQLRRYKEQKIYQLFVHPMYGFQVDYLSDEYFDFFAHTVREAKALGMKIWIYDEYNWPSGTAGGAVIAEDPSLRSPAVKVLKREVGRGESLDLALGGRLLSAFAVSGREYEDITAQLSVGEAGRMKWTNEGAPVRAEVYYAAVQGGVLSSDMWSPFCREREGYIDACRPEPVRSFIVHTLEKYKEAVGDEFGKTIPGVFTDEPALTNIMDVGKGSAPWSADLEKRFAARFGYELLPLIYRLFLQDAEPLTVKTKYHYWLLMSELFAEHYVKQMAEWCAENDLILTGHLCGEEYLMTNGVQSGCFSRAISHFHLPGIDTIFTDQRIEYDSFNTSCALLSSAARLNGRDRTLCEAFSGSGWPFRLGDMKRVANRLTLYGVNMLMLMGGYYSLKGFRKRLPGGYPPAHSPNNVLFSHYGAFSDYVSRMAGFSAQGESTANVMVLYPETTGWALSNPEDHPFDYMNEKSTQHVTDTTVFAAVNALSLLGYQFEMGFESALEDARVEGGALVASGIRYEALVLPGVRFLTEKAAGLVRDFLKNGGKAVFFNSLCERAADTALGCDFTPFFFASAEERESFVDSARSSDAASRESFEGDAAFLVSSRLEYPVNRQLLHQFSRIMSAFGIARPLAMNDAETNRTVYVKSRRGRDGDYHMVINDSREGTRLTGCIAGAEWADAYDPDGGGALLTVRAKDGEGLLFEAGLEGYGSLLIRTGKGGAKPRPADTPPETGGGDRTVVLDGTFTFSAQSDNFLRPTFRLLHESEMPDALALKAESGERFARVFNRRTGLKWTEDLSGMNPIDENGEFIEALLKGLKEGRTYIAKAVFSVSADAVPLPGMQLVTEDMGDTEWYVNDCLLTEAEGKRKRYWDGDNVAFPIARLIHPGENTLLMIHRTPAWRAPHLLPFTAIAGDFGVDGTDAITKTADSFSARSWTEQGYPYFSGTGVYGCDFQLPGEGTALLSVDSGDAVTAYVNDQCAGFGMSGLRLLDITRFCGRGVNRLKLAVTNTNSNLFDRPIPSGLNAPPVIYVKRNLNLTNK